MDIVYLYHNNSENKVIGKSLTAMGMLECTLKEDTSIEHPTLIVSYTTQSLVTDTYLDELDYFYMPKFNRYYYVDEIRTLPGSRIMIRGSVDVLESFKTDILNLNVILDHSQTTGANQYLDSPIWVTNAKNSTSIINFSNGLLDSGEYILITVGG